MKTLNMLWRWRNIWIALLLIGGNGLTWLNAGTVASWPIPQPVLDPQIEELVNIYRQENSAGHFFRLNLNQQAISNTIAWFLDKNPKVPISQPYVEITPDSITGKVFVQVMGMRIPVSIKLNAYLKDGKPFITVLEIGAAGARLPGSVVTEVQSQLESSLRSLQRLPADFTRLELGEGLILVEGNLK